MLVRNVLVKVWLVSAFFPVISMGSTPCWKKPVYVVPLGKNVAKKLFDAYPKEVRDQILVDGSEQELGDVYKADIANNGQPVYVFVAVELNGSMHAESVSAVQAINHKLQSSEVPKPDDAGDGPFYFHTYYNKYTEHPEFLTRLCGKTYISFDLGQEKHNRDTFIWTAKNGKTVDACDSDWVNFERNAFNELYHAGKYDDASSQLNFYLDKCKGKMNPQVYLWMQNDMLLAAAKNSAKSDCKYIITQVKANPAYASTSEAFKKAFMFNGKLCQVGS